MHIITNWFIKNPVAANLLMWLILIAGVLSLFDMRIEGFPKIPPDTISVDVVAPGASVQQVDEGIAQKIEQSLEGVPGAKRVISYSSEAFVSVKVKKEDGYDLERLLDDIKVRVDGISAFPRLAERPIITREEFNFPALIVQVYGEVDSDVLQRVAKEVKSELLSQPEINKLKKWGVLTPAINIEINQKRLESYGLTLQDVANRISDSSLQYRTGTLRTDGGVISLRADRQAYQREEFYRIPLLEHSNGAQVFLGDVATVVDGYEQEEGQVRYQGKPAIGLEIYIDRKGNLLDVSELTNDVITQIRKRLPQGVEIDIWADQSVYISDRLSLLKSNAVQGLALVFILLALFLNIKLAFWVALGVVISIAGTLAMMGWGRLDYSLNDVTTFGMIITLGILVDDAVIVGESVFSQRGKIKDRIQGTQLGVAKVSTATIFGVLTSVAAFFPMLLIDNPLGKVMASFAGIVIIALLFSLLESKTILPAHLAATRFATGPSQKKIPGTTLFAPLLGIWHALQSILNRGLELINQQYYRPILQNLLVHRYATFIIFVSATVLAIGLITTGVIRTTFFPDIPGNIITVNVDMDKRTPYKLTLANARRIEASAWEVNQSLMQEMQLEEPPIVRVMTAVSDGLSIEIYAELQSKNTPQQQGQVATLDVLERWRQAVGKLEGVDSIHFSGSESTGGGFALQLSSKDEDALQQGVEQVSGALNRIEGVEDVRDDLKGAEAELVLSLKPEARHLGFTNASLAAQIGDAFGGLEVQRLQRNGEELRLMLRYSKTHRDSVEDLLSSRVQMESGQWVPLTAVAKFESRYSQSEIWRRNGKRATLIWANIDKSQISPEQVMATLNEGVIPTLKQRYPGLTISIAGELEEEDALKGGLVKALVLTLLLIYTLLAIPLQSYTQPFIIMSVIPFGFAGAAVGHLIMDIPLSLLSFFGMLALAGVVVNDSLVMLTGFNQLRREGMAFQDALVEAGSGRFRAIFLTTITTVAGLTPLLFETSEQAQYLIPAAVSLVFGELFATLVTLVAVPVVTHIFADIRGSVLRDRAGVDAISRSNLIVDKNEGAV